MSSEKLTLLVLVFGIINFITLFSFIVWRISSKVKSRIKQNKVDHYGDGAEKKVVDFLKKSFPRAVIMKDVYLKTNNGLTELDTIFISNKGIFIIEVKSHNGYIITEGKFWTQRWRDKVVRFHNPVHQNNVHKAALENVLRKRQSLLSLPIYTVVVFTSSNVTFSKNVKDVIKLSSLSYYIKRRKTDRRMTRDMIKRVESFISTNMETSRHRQTLHKKRIYENNAKKRAYRVNFR